VAQKNGATLSPFQIGTKFGTNQRYFILSVAS